MLVGYVSDERYVALCDVHFEFRPSFRGVAASLRDSMGSCGVAPPHHSDDDAPQMMSCDSSRDHAEFRSDTAVTVALSTISGAVYADISPGEYEVVLGRDGYGSKIVRINVDGQSPYHFRLLSDCLLGYMSPRCVLAGETSEFRVHAVVEYEVELWRYGATKEFIRRIGTYDEHGPRANMQITPDGDYTQTGVEWNKHGYHGTVFAQNLTAPERSGLYYLHARSKRGEFFSFPWVVAPGTPQAKIAVLASDVNWNAYNSFGGRSNYIHADCFPPTPTVNSRLELKRYTEAQHRTYDSDEYTPLSLDRPDPFNHIDEAEQLTDPISGRQGCHLAPAEWRLLGWLELNGFKHDLYSESLLHFDRVPLAEYDVLILSTHPEYWSTTMYERVKKWVFEDGGRLMYLGGNGLNCEVEFLDHQRIVYQNTRWSHSEPQYAPNGIEYESRFDKRHESEANLLGVAFTWPGVMTAAPYKVLAETHWCFAQTGLRNGDTFGAKSLHQRVPGGASGHETDETTAQSPANVRVLARGQSPGNGGAEIVYFETPSGGEVFSVGSITWPASILVDDGVARITENVIRRFTRE